MTVIGKAAVAAVGLAMIAGSASAKKDEVARPKVYVDLVGCKTVTDAEARLACFDAAAAELERDVDQKNLVMLDRTEVKKTKKSLFGFSFPKLPFFDDDDEDEESISRIETTFATVEPVGYGKWQFVLPDAGTWQTTEPMKYAIKTGQKVLIKKGAGGYLMQVGNGGYVRVKRVG